MTRSIFVTIHILPYWEDFPIRAKFAASHVDAIRKRMAVAFPNKEILIGETGWPSEGRMREGALPSRTNQARVVSEILGLAKQENFRVNLIEAYDQPWKRQLEGTVGGYWGLFDSAERALKYPPGEAISNFPFWKLQMGCGMVLSVFVFGAAWLTLRRRPWKPRLASWIAVGISATTAGILLGVATDKMFYESYGFGGWLGWGALLAAAIASPLLCANALMSGRALPTFLELLGPREDRARSVLTMVLGGGADRDHVDWRRDRARIRVRPALQGFSVCGADHGGGAVRHPDAAQPSAGGRAPDRRDRIAGLFAGAALYTGFNEGGENWQSLWTCAMYFLLAVTLWRGAGRANPRMSRPIAIPDRPIL